MLNENSFSEIINRYIKKDKSGFLSYFGRSLCTRLYTKILNGAKYLDITDELIELLNNDIEYKINVKEMYDLIKKPTYFNNVSADIIGVGDNTSKYEKDYFLNTEPAKKTKNNDKNKIIFKKVIKI